MGGHCCLQEFPSEHRSTGARVPGSHSRSWLPGIEGGDASQRHGGPSHKPPPPFTLQRQRFGPGPSLLQKLPQKRKVGSAQPREGGSAAHPRELRSRLQILLKDCVKAEVALETEGPGRKWKNKFRTKGVIQSLTLPWPCRTQPLFCSPPCVTKLSLARFSDQVFIQLLTPCSPAAGPQHRPPLGPQHCCSPRFAHWPARPPDLRAATAVARSFPAPGLGRGLTALVPSKPQTFPLLCQPFSDSFTSSHPTCMQLLHSRSHPVDRFFQHRHLVLTFHKILSI